MRNKSISTIAILFTISLGVTVSQARAQGESTATGFEAPIRFKADGKIIDTGDAWGHSAPCLEDIDGDGLQDLIVGDFSGKFRLYQNVGAAKEPLYKSKGFVKGGDEEAMVQIYCCIGSQARFHDLNGDGHRDMIANSYDPGHCYVFWGMPNHRFAAREELLDKSGVPIRSAPIQQQTYQSFGSFFELVDWDDDGDLDILIGCFDGLLKVRINEGTQTKPSFASENVDVVASDGPLKVKAHLCPKISDWDNDGLWDIIAGSDDGSVTFFRNIGKKTMPAFAQGETLIKAHSGHGYNRTIWDDSQIVPGIRSQVEVTDHNGDGKLDLVLGDFYTAYDFKTDLTALQKQEVAALISKSESMSEVFREKMDALRKDFAIRYPGDKIFSDEADQAWTKEYGALQESPEAKSMEENDAEFVKSIRPYLASTRGTSDESFDLAKPHGHVWLYLQK